jgi:hypothetical protein
MGKCSDNGSPRNESGGEGGQDFRGPARRSGFQAISQAFFAPPGPSTRGTPYTRFRLVRLMGDIIRTSMIWSGNLILGRGDNDNGCQPAIARTHSRAFSLFVIPGKCRRSSATADNSPLSSNTRRMTTAVASSTLNMARTWADNRADASEAVRLISRWLR